MLAIVLEAALRSLILGAVAWAALTCLRVKNPLTSLTVWTGLLYVAIAMPLLVVARHALLPALPVLPVIPLVQLPPSVDAMMAGPMAIPRPSSVGALPSGSDAASYNLWPMIAVTLYGAVAFLLLLRLGIGLVRGWRLRRRAAPFGNALHVSGELTAPVVFGSAIILPADYAAWPEAKRLAVLAHERSHVARGDFYVQLLAAVYRAIFWLNPLGWWLHRELAVLAELASDDAAAHAHGDRLSYAEILIEVARDARPLAGAVAMARGPAVTLRVARLMSGATSAASLPRRQRVTIGGTSACIVLGALIATPAVPESSRMALTIAKPDANLVERISVPVGRGFQATDGKHKAAPSGILPSSRQPFAVAGGVETGRLDSERDANSRTQLVAIDPVQHLTSPATSQPAPVTDAAYVDGVGNFAEVAQPLTAMPGQRIAEDGSKVATSNASSAVPPLTAAAKVEAAAKMKADRKRRRAEIAEREAEEYVPLGSHIRGAEAAGGSKETLTKADSAVRDSSRVAIYR